MTTSKFNENLKQVFKTLYKCYTISIISFTTLHFIIFRSIQFIKIAL